MLNRAGLIAAALANAAMGTRLDQLIAKLLSTCAGQLTLDRQITLYR